MDESALQRFTADGYIVLRDLISSGRVDDVFDRIRWICEHRSELRDELIQIEPAVREGLVQPADFELGVRKLFRIARHDSFFRDLASDPAILDVARSLTGQHLRLAQSMLLMKSPGVSTIKVWHQDNAYFRLSPSKVVGFWIACDPATVANGCMHIVPGSHHGGLQAHSGPGDEYGSDVIPDEREIVAVPLNPGDALVFHGELLHFTPENQTQFRRRAIQLHYADAACEAGEGPDGFRFRPEIEFGPSNQSKSRC